VWYHGTVSSIQARLHFWNALPSLMMELTPMLPKWSVAMGTSQPTTPRTFMMYSAMISAPLSVISVPVSVCSLPRSVDIPEMVPGTPRRWLMMPMSIFRKVKPSSTRFFMRSPKACASGESGVSQ
jgi:hypothetical protein